MSALEKTGLRILSLEDSDIDAELVLHELLKGGIHFISRRVQTAGDFARELRDFHPELILADYRLPNFDGAQALVMAKECCPDVPMIIISGAVGEETAVELLKNGATDFVLKDRLAGRLVPAVARALREVAERKARQEAEANLHALNKQLEARVAERTRELSEKNARMEEDLEMARELQMAFLPQHYPTIPRGTPESDSAVRFCSIFRPSNSVSGDFYNIVRISDTAVGVFICDVMGHGVRAALVTSMMRALEEKLGESAVDPGALLTEMNHALSGIFRQSGTTLFATVCYLVFDAATSRITMANAGHPSPLLVRGSRREVVPLTTPRTPTARRAAGPAIGLFENMQYRTYEYQVDPADLILLFTDGLFEVENTLAEPFTEERLHESVRRCAGLPFSQLVHDVYAEIERFAEGQPFSDDVCLVGMKIARNACPAPCFA